MRLPEIADRLREKAAETGDDELLTLADQIGRRRVWKRARPSSQPMTDELAGQIRDYAKFHPFLSQAAIAEAFNVNPGRVSEAVRGKRQ